MRRWKASLLLLTLAAFSLAQTASQNTAAGDPIHRVGERLACLCGTCNNTVASCPMLHCHYAEPAKQKIAAMAAAGASDAAIIESFVKEYGLRALAAPPAEGFNLLGWAMPFLGLAAGLTFTWWFLQRFRRRPAPAAGGDLDPTLARYRQRIEKELENLD